MNSQAMMMCTIVAAFSHAALGQSLNFDAIEIPDLQEPAPAFAEALNDHGVVVGLSQLSATGETFRPWIWSVDGGLINLFPSLGLTWFASATDINNRGEVIGMYADLCLEPDPHPECPDGIIPAGGVLRGVVWATDGSGRFVELPSVAAAQKLDNLGVIPGALGSDGLIGASSQVRPPGEFSFGYPVAILWDQSGDPVMLGEGTIPGATIVNVTDFNDNGQYCGQVSIGGESRAFFFDPMLGYTVLPRLSDPSLGPELANGVALNNSGQVIGNADILHNDGGVVFTEPYGAFVWDPTAGMQFLGLYTVYDINDHGQIVGSTSPGPGQPPDAHLYDDGVWHTIQDLTDIDPRNWHLHYAKAINNGGQILVIAIAMTEEAILQSGEIQPFLLTPKQVPGDITGDGTVDVNDLLSVINAWGPCNNPGNCPADIAPPPNGDGAIDVNDLLMVINNWG